MALFSTHEERDELGGGRIRSTFHMKRMAHRFNGSLRRNSDLWVPGDATFPHVIETSSMLAYWKAGAIRLCPTRDPQVYVEFGRPLVRPSTTWQNLALAMPTRSGNSITSVNANYDVSMVMGGFKADCWDFEFKNGWQPPNRQLAFKVGLNGMTRDGRTLLVNGVPQMEWRLPYVYDAADMEAAHLPVETDFALRSGDWYMLLTLPDMSGLVRPCLDPTLTLQPDATDGVDTMIRDGIYADTNYGTDTSLFVKNSPLLDYSRTTVLLWPLTSLPTSVVSSATMYGYWNTTYSGAVTVTAYKCLRAWVESQATWNVYSNGNNWGTGGAANSTTDYDGSTLLCSNVLSSAPSENGEVSFPSEANIVAAVQAAAGSTLNVLLRCNSQLNTNWSVHSSDGATASYRPKLVVEYTLPSSGVLAQIAGPRVGAFIH